jgi:hypothetical protein
MIDSLRTFGGELAEVHFWVFVTDLDSARGLEGERTRLQPLTIPDLVSAYPLGKKVAACARAEELAPAGTRSLVWVDAACLFCQPPTLFALGTDCEAAFRPVHIRNVGLPPSEPLDAFWGGIYAALGMDDIRTTVTSFVDGQLLRTYFNSHAFAVNPTLGLMRRWYELFQRLISDAAFQSAACVDERHQIFLFQALLSALVAASVGPGRVRVLPPTYNYPYNLQERIPAERKLAALNEAVCFTYEERDIHPNAVTGIEVREPLRSWLDSHLPRKE